MLVVFFVYLLWGSRTPIPTTIWETFSSSNLVVYLAMTFLLLVIILYRGKPEAKLSLIVIHSVVSCMFKVVVCESRYGYDTWISLAYSKIVYSGEYPKIAPFTIYTPLPLLSKIYHVTERVNLYSLGVIFARMFSVDIWWSHLLLSPLLWGIFIPLLTYRISKFVCNEEVVSLLSALLSLSVPSFISWGSVTLSQSLAWIFCIGTVYLSLRYLLSKKGLWLALVIAFATFITHELVGVLSFCVVLLAITYQKVRDLKYEKIRGVLLLGTFASAVLLIPSLLLASQIALVGQRTTFSLKSFDGLSTYEAIFVFLFGAYVDMNFSDVLVSVIIPLLGIIGLIYTVLESGNRTQNRKASVLILLCFALVIVDYTLVKLFMTKVPFSPERMWIFRDLLVIPFAAIVLSSTMNYLSSKLAFRKSVKTSRRTKHSAKIASQSVLSISSREIAVLAGFILLISSLTTSAVYNAYSHSTYMRAWTTTQEIEAARYIEETTPRNETYVVLCEATTRLAGYAVVGPQNPRAYYFGAYESKILTPLYNEMVTDPSLGPILEAQSKNDASIVYVIVSKFRPPVDGNSLVIEQMMDLPYCELKAVFGEGVYVRGKFEASVYVFKVRPPRERMVTGTGPQVYIYNNQTYVKTTFSLDIVTYEASYVATVSRLPSYNITGWPTYWSFESITPSPIERYVDANKWINFTASETMMYSVKWTANMLYRNMGWKDDSFNSGWQVKPKSVINWEEDPQHYTDGDVLTMTGLFQEETRQRLVLERDIANVSTDEYPYVVVKWRSTGTCASVLVTYDGDVTNVLMPELKWKLPIYGQYSEEWKVSIAKLPAGKVITSLRLYLDDYPVGTGYLWHDLDGWYSVYYDYIMISNMATPEF